MSNYRQNTQSLSKKTQAATAQTVQTPGTVENSAGGFVYELDKWDRLNRFLILGSDSPTYYASAKTLSVENAKCVLECAKEDGIRLVKTIVDISHSGRAIKNTPALFALALASSVEDVNTKREALRNLSKVARTGTHLFEFANFVDGLRGWGYGLRNAFSHWYNDMDADRLALQVVKYPQRVTEEGNSKSSWSHDDLLRKSHPKGDKNHNMIYDFVTKEGKLPKKVPVELKILQGATEVKAASSAKEVAAIVEKYELPHELVPKEYANSPEVWEALIPNMPITATLRTLNRMTSYGVLKPLSSNLKTIVDRLLNVEQIKNGRVHPISVLSALKTYAQGRGMKGSLTWTPIARINDALNEMLYLAFDQVEPTGKNLLLGIDISGSMDSGTIGGLNGVTPREAAAVMAMVTARSEPNHYAIGFTASGGSYYGGNYGVTPLDISPRDRLDVVVQKMQRMPMGRTDCALAVMHAYTNKLDVDGFVVYTDNETYAGSIKPQEALNKFRKERNPQAKLVAVGMTATEFTIADPNDAGSLSVVGFDTSAPAVISDFFRTPFRTKKAR